MSKNREHDGMDRDERAQWVPLIIRARKVWNWTQQDLADAAGVSLKSVGNLESGNLVPQAGTVEKVREALKLSPNMNVAEHEVDERQRRRYEEANRRANAQLNEEDSGLSLSRFTNAELLRELLTRAEDTEYAESLDREAEKRHWIALNQALDEIGPLSLVPSLSEGTPSVREAIAAHEDGDIAGEQESRNEP
jgi:transcriptional regulator with XRE-family HTH domain